MEYPNRFNSNYYNLRIISIVTNSVNVYLVVVGLVYQFYQFITAHHPQQGKSYILVGKPPNHLVMVSRFSFEKQVVSRFGG